MSSTRLETHECPFCLSDDVPEGKTFCNAACKASWSLLFEDPEDVVPDDSDVYPEDGRLPLASVSI
jgi:hypothetical protein